MRQWILSCAALCLLLSGPAVQADNKPNSTAAEKRIASATPASKQAQKKLAEEKRKQAYAARVKRAKQKAAEQVPFVNGHYVLTGHLPVNGYHKGVPVVVIVDKGSHSTYALQLQNHKIFRILTVSNAVGDLDTPTPPGPYRVVQKRMFPRWVPPRSIDPKQKPVPPYNQTHKNPLGVAAIYLNKFEILLHGTNTPNQIRKSVSHGCVRHSNADIKRLYSIVNAGDRVYIVNKFRGKVLNRSDFVR